MDTMLVGILLALALLGTLVTIVGWKLLKNSKKQEENFLRLEKANRKVIRRLQREQSLYMRSKRSRKGNK